MKLFNKEEQRPEMISLNGAPLIYAKEPIKKEQFLGEALQGLVKNEKIRFPKNLGIEHPFDYEAIEKLGKRFGVIDAILDKHVDFILSAGLNVESEDERAKQIVEDFNRDFNIRSFLRPWIKEALKKGLGVVEIGKSSKTGAIEELKMLNSNYLYKDRDDTGKLLKLNQYTKPIDQFAANQDQMISFDLDEVAILDINVNGDDAYGMGVIYPMVSIIDQLIGSRKEMHTIMERKSNNPIIFRLGHRNGKPHPYVPTQAEMEQLGSRLEWLNNKHEWVISDMVEPMTLDFGNLGDKFEFVIKNDLHMVYLASQIPALLMGDANVNQGIAKEQMSAWMFRIQSMREDIEKVIEQQFYQPLLEANGLSAHVEIVWGLPSQEEKNEKIKTITELLKIPFLSSELSIRLQEQVAELLDIPAEDIEPAEEERRREEEDEKQPVVPTERQKKVGAEPRDNGVAKDLPLEHLSESVDHLDNMTVSEWVNFDYGGYVEDILEAIREDPFVDIRGATKEQWRAGLLNFDEIEKLRLTLEEGIQRNWTIREIQKTLDKRIKFKDRLQMKDNSIVIGKNGKPKVSVAAKNRAIMIARSETVRMSNEGAVKNYKKNGVEKVRWVAAMSKRTCDFCAAQNGIVYPIEKTIKPPLHPMCFINSQIPIYTSKGWKPIGKVQVGDLVLSHKGKFRKVTKLLEDVKYNGEVIKIHYGWENQKGKIKKEFLTFTPEHPILTKRGWVEAKDITEKDNIVFLAKKCKECGSKFPHFKIYDNVKFCSLSCANKYTAREQYKDPMQHKIRSEYAKKQMEREYKKGIRDGKKITEAAHKKNKELWDKREHPLLKWVEKNDAWNKGLTKKEHPALKAISEGRLGKDNPVHRMTPETKKARLDKYMKWLNENPDKHPNKIMAQKGFISKPQKEMYYTVLEYCSDAEIEYAVRTEKGIKFMDVAIPSLKIGLEFNGKYWHQDIEKDIIRQEAIVDEGWVILNFNEDNIKELDSELTRVLKNHNDEYEFMCLPVLGIKKWVLKKARKLYNFSVDKDESYIAKGMVTHNCRCTLVPVITENKK